MSERVETLSVEAQPLRWVLLGWYYDHGGRRLGPFSNGEIQRQVAAGELPRDQSAFVGWRRGAEVQFLDTELRLALGAPAERGQVAAGAAAGERAACSCRSSRSTTGACSSSI